MLTWLLGEFDTLYKSDLPIEAQVRNALNFQKASLASRSAKNSILFVQFAACCINSTSISNCKYWMVWHFLCEELGILQYSWYMHEMESMMSNVTHATHITKFHAWRPLTWASTSHTNSNFSNPKRLCKKRWRQGRVSGEAWGALPPPLTFHSLMFSS